MASADIRIADLRRIVIRILDHIEYELDVDRVTLSEDAYWDLPPRIRFDMNSQPGEFDVGSLADDWKFISMLLDPSTDPVPLQLTEVAPILDFLGRAIRPTRASTD